MKTARMQFYSLLCVVTLMFCGSLAAAQTPGLILGGRVLDPSGALVPGANVSLVQERTQLATTSDGDGHYQFRNLAAGTYHLTVDAPGFSHLAQDVTLTANRQLDLSLLTVVEAQKVDVTAESNGVSVSNDQNSNMTVLKGDDLDAFSDDPDTLQNQLQALAGPAAGPDGGQIYIDGFTGGQLPPKSSILEVRINQNPFSAENDRIGYGRIDILTKPGAPKVSGHVVLNYLNSALDTGYPLVSQQPSYQYYAIGPDITGPIGKNASYFAAFQYFERQNQDMIVAGDPNNPNGQVRQSFPAPYSTMQSVGTLNFQIKNHIFSAQDTTFRVHQDGKGVGGLALAEQAVTGYDLTNAVMLRDSIIVNQHLLNEVAVRWVRDRSNRVPSSFRPSVTVQGAFTSGGSSQGIAVDHGDFVEFHDYATISLAYHTIRAGVLMRSRRDAFHTAVNTNGSYTFQNYADYQAGKPSLYTATIIHNPTTRILAFEGAVFFQDEWKARPNLSIGYGIRLEGQNRIHDPLDVEPRLALTWAPHNDGHTPPKTAFHVGFGLFENRFNFTLEEQTIQNNGVAQQTYVVNNPSFYDPNHAIDAITLANTGSSHPTINTLDPHFHAAQYIQAGGGADHSIGKKTTLNVSYLFTQGIHQYLTNNITAPLFNPTTYTVTGSAPSTLNYQYQSGGVFKEHQFILTTRTQYKKLNLQATYTWSHAAGDSQGTGYFPTDSRNPGLDYGRATFSIANQIQAFGTWALPHGFMATGMLFAQSGTPYNITLGSDLTQNSQFNARPTYGSCGSTDVVTTAFGCLDTNPTGKGEEIVPFNLGTGPANMVMTALFTKSIGVGPHRRPAAPVAAVGKAATPNTPAQVNTTVLSGANSAPRRYSLNLQAGATNIFNVANRAAPNGVLSSPLFGQSQGLAAGGAYALSSPGNRTVFFRSIFAF